MAAVATDYGGGPIRDAVQFGQNAGGILFTGITLAYLLSQGGEMLAEVYKKGRYFKGQEDLLKKMVADKVIPPEKAQEYQEQLEQQRNK